jgi:putative FmdB family regulatory protein
MPVYEYRCQSCGQVSEFLIRTTEMSKAPCCPDCGSDSMSRILSVPSLVRERTSAPGTTCCGRTERCDKPPCSEGGGCRRH